MNEIQIFERIAALDAQRKELAVSRIALEVRIRKLQQADTRAINEIARLNDLLKTQETARQEAYEAANAKHPLPLDG